MDSLIVLEYVRFSRDIRRYVCNVQWPGGSELFADPKLLRSRTVLPRTSNLRTRILKETRHDGCARSRGSHLQGLRYN